MLVQHGLKSGKIFILDKALSIRILLLLFFAFLGLNLENVWLFSLFFTYSTE